MESASTIHIDLEALARNVGAIRSLLAPGCRLCCVVKADAYGLGAAKVAPALVRAGADMLAVYRASEACLLSEAGVPVLVLGPMRSFERAGAEHRMLLAGRLHATIHGLAHAEELAEAARDCGVSIPVHLEVDTGMGRGGGYPDEGLRVLHWLAAQAQPALRLAGICTHFSDSGRDGDWTEVQAERFRTFLQQAAALMPEGVQVHAANTHACMRGRQNHFTMVRVGLAWTGFARDGYDGDAGPWGALEGVVSWRSRVVQVREMPIEAPVGYGSCWRSLRPSRVGLVPVGYADGYRAVQAAGGMEVRRIVRVRAAAGEDWREAPVVGTVSMDQLAIDLTDVAPAGTSAVGWEVELVGSDPAAGNSLPLVARSSCAHAYEFLCGIHPRVVRCHHAQPRAHSADGGPQTMAVGA